jgi:hypothetical protein
MQKPIYFEKSWCVGQFRGIPNTTNLGKRSPTLTRGKVPQCKGLRNSFNGGSTIPYPFERAVTRPKLNAMQYCYGVGSNFITGVPPEFEDLLTLKLYMKPKYNDPNFVVSKQGFTRSDLPDPIHNETSIHMRMTKQRPFLEAQNFHHKLQILIEAIIGCKTSSETHRSHDYFQYD